MAPQQHPELRTTTAEASTESEPGHSKEAAHPSVGRSLFNLNEREYTLYHSLTVTVHWSSDFIKTILLILHQSLPLMFH